MIKFIKLDASTTHPTTLIISWITAVSLLRGLEDTRIGQNRWGLRLALSLLNSGAEWGGLYHLLLLLFRMLSCTCWSPHTTYLVWGREVGPVWAGAVLWGRTARYQTRIRQSTTLHFRQHTFLVQRWFQKTSIAVKLHQAKNLLWRKEMLCF